MAAPGIYTVMPCGCVFLAYLGLATVWDGLPRTLQFEVDEWRNQRWGLHDIDRSRLRCEVAVASDGSRMNRCGYKIFRHYFIPNREGAFRSLYLRHEDVGYFIDEEIRTVRGGPCSCTWKPLTMFVGDDECRRTAEMRLPGGKRIGNGQITGHSVIRYGAVDEEGTDFELSLAPGLGCEVMEEIQTWPGTLGIPSAKWHYRVTSYKPGDPDWQTFQLPSGYAIQERTQ